MQIIKGSKALSVFKQSKLLAELQALDKNVQAIEAEYVHFVSTNQELPSDQQAELEKLLTYGEPEKLSSPSGILVLVAPRPGTISPWSSKATDIAHNTGLAGVDRIERGIAYYISSTANLDPAQIASLLHDRMVETTFDSLEAAAALFDESQPKALGTIDILGTNGREVLEKANEDLILALAPDEIDYLYESYKELGRNPTDAELMMFGVVNSEHCRHKIFNAAWKIDGEIQPKSLFKMIKNTYEHSSKNVLSAYKDNAAVLTGSEAGYFVPDNQTGVYGYTKEPLHIVIKAETHNHPTAIAPFPGAATGTGGEIRDEAATGRGTKTKVGFAGYSVSNLNIPGLKRPWEKDYGSPSRIKSAKDIMIEAPLGAASYGNEFGRPNIAGYFRTYEQIDDAGNVRGYHKPIMIAGGYGNIREKLIEKQSIPVGTKLVVLGGQSMLIGLGGGSGSSMQTGASKEDLDFASVQRSNPEMQRRAQEVINACSAMGENTPILSIHDVGAGGLSNAFPELVHDAGRGGKFELRAIPSLEPGMSPMEIWCNESQERYVLAVQEARLAEFEAFCEREHCPYAVVGEATADEQLVVHDALFQNNPVDIPLSLLFGKPPKMERVVQRQAPNLTPLSTTSIDVDEAVKRVLQLPAVGSKKFLITIGDRSVTGLIMRDQMVGPWQVPVSDVAVTARSYDVDAGEAMAIGERTPIALIDSAAAARMAVGEALTNIVASDVEKISDVKLSANWMAAAGIDSEDERLFDAVQAVGEEFCPELGITIPVGKDSLSMRTKWQEAGTEKSVTAPVSLIISAFAPVKNVTKTLTPLLKDYDNTSLILVDISEGKARLGGSALAQVFNQIGNETPDVTSTQLKKFFEIITKLKTENKLLAYHDRSDGGLFATLAEISFASRRGLSISLDSVAGETELEQLFNEELGAVIQVRKSDEAAVLAAFGNMASAIGTLNQRAEIVFTKSGKEVYKNTRTQLEQWWADTSYHMQRLRDNSDCADEEFALIVSQTDPGLSPASAVRNVKNTTYDERPKVAIFREQGVNGQVEMAAAFSAAGFSAVDVHLQDLMNGSVMLNDFVGLVACGGFSYGDVLGAGEGWAKTILLSKSLKEQLKTFFERKDTFSLGVCNGCQMLSQLKSIIPGAENWPAFVKNTSEQFEARLSLVKVLSSPSILLRGLEGSYLPVPVAHGEGRVLFADDTAKQAATVSLQFVDNDHNPTQIYPYNPNGSPEGMTGFTTPDGRATIMMPHPERAFQTRQLSWYPDDWSGDSPWMQIFHNARAWVEEN